MFDQSDQETRNDHFQTCTEDMIILLARRKPDILPEVIREAGRREDRPLITELLKGYSWNASLDKRTSSFDDCNKRFVFGRDGIMGKLGSSFSMLSLMMAYFTLATWLGKGRTLGKWAMGIQVFRLNGQAISLWQSFERTGGYAASLSTFALGFFQALWQRNRQTSHDLLAGTVVIDLRRRQDGQPSDPPTKTLETPPNRADEPSDLKKGPI